MKELPSVVWSLRTTPSRATSFTPFFLVYGAEAISPTDLEYGSPRTRAYDDRSNRTNREDSLDQLEEARDMALLHSARYQQSLRCYHARGVRSCWGEGKDATLRSKSSPLSLVRRRQNGQGHPSLGTTSDEGLRRGLPTVRPRPVRRPTRDPTHCNGPCVAAVCYRPHL
jgi:hypothetical protein